MKAISTYKNKKVFVLGLAKSGVNAAKLLHRLGAFVTVNDSKPFDENIEAQELLKLGITVITGHHPVEILEEGFELLVKNPGIPYSNKMIQKAKDEDIPIITEVELAFQVSEAPIVGITGTNGKTTTTSMVTDILNYYHATLGGKAYAAGNIGIPASEVAQEVSSEDWIIMELSSFQLLGIDEFKPRIAVITNIYEAHLDYHGSREEYVYAKWQIQKNMDTFDYLIINADQDELMELASESRATVIPFSTKSIMTEGAYLSENTLYFKDERILESYQLGVPGKHNIENALASIAVTKIIGAKNDVIQKSLTNFHGVKHRLQFVANVNGRKFYNDSKSTNTLATINALTGFDRAHVILIAGGLDRGNDFDELIPSINGIKAMVVYGETKQKLMESAQKAEVNIIIKVETLKEAINRAYDVSMSKDIILLSPACASWDQFKNFEVRGDIFIEEVEKLKEK